MQGANAREGGRELCERLESAEYPFPGDIRHTEARHLGYALIVCDFVPDFSLLRTLRANSTTLLTVLKLAL